MRSALYLAEIIMWILIFMACSQIPLLAQQSRIEAPIIDTSTGLPTSGKVVYIVNESTADSIRMNEIAGKPGFYRSSTDNVPYGLFKVYVDGSLNTQKIWVGSSRIRTFIEGVDPEADNRIASQAILDGTIIGNDVADSTLSLAKLTTAANNFIGSGGSVTNNPDDQTLENKAGSTIGFKDELIDFSQGDRAIVKRKLVFNGGGVQTTNTNNATLIQIGSINAGNAVPVRNTSPVSTGERRFYVVRKDSTAPSIVVGNETRMRIERNTGTIDEANGLVGIVMIDSAYAATRTYASMGVVNNPSGDSLGAAYEAAGVHGRIELTAPGSNFTVAHGVLGDKAVLQGGAAKSPPNNYAVTGKGWIAAIGEYTGGAGLPMDGAHAGFLWRTDLRNTDGEQYYMRKHSGGLFEFAGYGGQIFTIPQGTKRIQMDSSLYIGKTGTPFNSTTLFQIRPDANNTTPLVVANSSNIRAATIGLDGSGHGNLAVRNSSGTTVVFLTATGNSYSTGTFSVAGSALTAGREFQVNGDGWITGDLEVAGSLTQASTAYAHPDYVFQPGYDLPSLEYLRDFTQENKHLPGMPSAAEVKEKGVELFEQNRLLLEKLEEAYLQIFELDQRLKNLETVRD